MMKIDKKELKIISYDFRTIANRLINCSHNDGLELLKKFLRFVENNELIFDYIQSTIKQQEMFEGNRSDVVYASMGDTPEEEVSFTYQFLKYGSVNYSDYYMGFAFRYSSGNARDSIKEFNNRIVLPFVNYIEGYLTKIGIQMGYDEEVKYMITINNENGQVNLSQDNSTINAVQNQSSNNIEQLIKEIKNLLDNEISKENQEIILENAECIQEELQKEIPRKGLIKSCINGLNSILPKITGSVKLAAAVTSLIQFASTYL
ncbi:MAG: hypothetical protein SCL54_10580 [Bacillota bacterium]|nr:hypothetical protein [Bacillota bacterium]